MTTAENELLSLSRAAAACPPVDGRRPHTSTIWRWMDSGINGVKLEHVRVGRRVCTTREALDRFFAELADAPRPEKTAPPCLSGNRSSKQRERDLAAARETLKKHGITTGGLI